MTNAEILKYQQRAKYVATQRGYSELADDFAQELILQFIESPDRGATVDQLFIDYLRRVYGDTRTASGAARSRASRHWIFLDELSGEGQEQSPLSDRLAAPQPESESERTHRECSFLFEGRKSEIYEAYFIDELTEKSIGERMQISASRVCQILGPMKKEIQEYYWVRKALERMEWDENFSKLQIDWIRL